MQQKGSSRFPVTSPLTPQVSCSSSAHCDIFIGQFCSRAEEHHAAQSLFCHLSAFSAEDSRKGNYCRGVSIAVRADTPHLRPGAPQRDEGGEPGPGSRLRPPCRASFSLRSPRRSSLVSLWGSSFQRFNTRLFFCSASHRCPSVLRESVRHI